MQAIEVLEKEKVSEIPFSVHEVLASLEEIKERRRLLERGMVLGNIYKQTVKIHFMCVDKKTYKTEATIWTVTEKYVMIKGGRMIPLHSIVKVDT
ncbi:MAG: hypothetical protein LAT68_14985 [Cyclobacteriaceae bacterium]|nr:hypothetical protein [Cyclobacteriaceae bacterium]MCH8517626.1 hypothetical protein [Cyclobacteriaceae bacterium]